MIITLDGVLALLFAMDPNRSRGAFFMHAHELRIRTMKELTG